MINYNKKERRGLPGGPNEQFTYVTGFFTQSNPFRSMIQYQDGAEVIPPYDYIDRDFGKRFGNDSSVLGYSNNAGVFLGERLPEAEIIGSNPTSLLSKMRSDYAKLHPLPEGVKWGANTLEGDPELSQKWLSDRNAYIYERMRAIPQEDLSTEINKASVENYMDEAFKREIEMLSTPEGLYRIALSLKDAKAPYRNQDKLPISGKKQDIVTFDNAEEEAYYIDQAKKRLRRLENINLKTKPSNSSKMRGRLGYYSPSTNSIVLRDARTATDVFAHEMNHAIGNVANKWQDRYLMDHIEFKDLNDFDTDYMLSNSDEITAFLRGTRASMQKNGYIQHPYEYITAEQLKEAYNKRIGTPDNEELKSQIKTLKKAIKVAESDKKNITSQNVRDAIDKRIQDLNGQIKQYERLINDIKNNEIELPYRFLKSIKPTEENFKNLEKVINSLADNNQSNTYDDFAKFGKELKPKRKLKKKAQRGQEVYDYEKNLDFETMQQYVQEVGMPYAWRQFNDAEKAMYRKVMSQFNYPDQPVDVYDPRGVNAEYYQGSDGQTYMQNLPAASIKDIPLAAGKYIKEFDDRYPKPKGSNLVEDWENKRNEYVVQGILKDNPELTERDVEYINSLTPTEQKFLSTDRRFQQSYWRDMVDGLSAIGALEMGKADSQRAAIMRGDKPTTFSEFRINEIQNDPTKTDYEKQQLTSMYEQAPGAAAFGEVLSATEAPIGIAYNLGKATYDPNYTMDQALEGEKSDITTGEELAMDAGYEAAMFFGTAGLGNLAKGVGKGITKRLLKSKLKKKFGADYGKLADKLIKENPKLKEIFLNTRGNMNSIRAYMNVIQENPKILDLFKDSDLKNYGAFTEKMDEIFKFIDGSHYFLNSRKESIDGLIQLANIIKKYDYDIKFFHDEFKNNSGFIGLLGLSAHDSKQADDLLNIGLKNKNYFKSFLRDYQNRLGDYKFINSDINRASENFEFYMKHYDKLKDKSYQAPHLVNVGKKFEKLGKSVDEAFDLDDISVWNFFNIDLKYIKALSANFKDSKLLVQFVDDNHNRINKLKNYTKSSDQVIKLLKTDPEIIPKNYSFINDLGNYVFIDKIYKNSNDIIEAIKKSNDLILKNPEVYRIAKYHPIAEKFIENSTDLNKAFETIENNINFFNRDDINMSTSLYQKFEDFDIIFDIYNNSDKEILKAINTNFINYYDKDQIIKILKNDKEAIKKIAKEKGITNINDLEKITSLDLIDPNSLSRKFPNNPNFWGGNVEYKKQLLEEAQNTAKDRALKQIEDTDLDFNYEAVQKEIDALNDEDYITESFKDTRGGFYRRSEAEGTDPFVTEYTDDGYISADSWLKWAKEHNPVFNEGFNDIAAIKANIPEYRAIEMREKANGTWMKNADGSDFSGSPEMFVQQRSSAFQKAYPEDRLLTQKGVRDLIKEKEDPEFVEELQSYIPGVTENVKRLRWNDRKRVGINPGSTEPLLGVHSNTAPSNLFTFFDETKEGGVGAMFGPGQYTASAAFTPVTPIPEYLKDIPKELWPQKYRYGVPNSEEISDTKNHTYLYGPKRVAFYQDVENPLLSRGRSPGASGNPNILHPDEIKKQMKSIDDVRFRDIEGYDEFIESLPEGLTEKEIKEAVSKRYRQETTESLTPIVNYPVGTGRSSGAFLPGEIITPYARPLKSALGNSGLFDRSNMWRNEKGAFYRGLAAPIIGAEGIRLYMQQQEEQAPSERIGLYKRGGERRLKKYQQGQETPSQNSPWISESDPQYAKLYYQNKVASPWYTTDDQGNEQLTLIPRDLAMPQNIEVTEAAPYWFTYKKQLEKELDPGLANRSDIINKKVAEKIKEQHNIDYRDSEYAIEQINKLSEKEREILMTLPEFQTTLWQDFKNGLRSMNYYGSIYGSSPGYVPNVYDNLREREKIASELYKSSIQSDPYLTKTEKRNLISEDGSPTFGTGLGVLAPFDIPIKAVQSIYKDDYTLDDALEGKKNNASFGEDFAIGLATAGIPSLAKSVAKGVGKAGIKKIGKKLVRSEKLKKEINDLLENYRLEKDISNKNDLIQQQGNEYYKQLSKPESIKRLQNFSEEYDIDLVDAYEQSFDRWDHGKNILGPHDRFQVAGDNVFYDDIEDAMGVSTIQEVDKLNNFFKRSNKNSSKKSVHKNYINVKSDIEDYHTIVWHELSHDINSLIIDKSPKLKQDIQSIFVDNLDNVDLKAVENARLKARKLFKSNISGNTKDIRPIKEIAEDEFNYITKPTETWAFLSTNLRQDLKNTGLIKEYTDVLTPEILDEAIKNGNTTYSRFEPYIKDKDKFIELFNKMTLSIAPAVLYLQSQNSSESKPTFKRGGERRLQRGGMSKDGYKRYSPDVNNDYNIIPSGNITMKDVDFPVMGIDNFGNKQMMYPGYDYVYPGNTVFEIPMLKKR